MDNQIDLVKTLTIETLVGLVGVAIGSIISFVSMYINQKLVEKREKRKDNEKREEQAISQMYSPLAFILDKTRGLFAIILALKDTYKSVSNKKKENDKSFLVLQYFAAKKAAKYPDEIEKLLKNKAGLIDSKFFYADLMILQSYLSTIVDYLEMLINKSTEKANLLTKYLSSFSPLLCELDQAVSEMRKYVITRTMRHQIEYKQFFDEKAVSEFEKYINQINLVIVGIEVPDWEKKLKELGKRIIE